MSDDTIVLGKGWWTPRPLYMWEIEPQAHPEAWKSKLTTAPVFDEAVKNRDNYEHGRITHATYRTRAVRIILERTA